MPNLKTVSIFKKKLHAILRMWVLGYIELKTEQFHKVISITSNQLQAINENWQEELTLDTKAFLK